MKRWLSFLLLCACLGAPGAARAQTPVLPEISVGDAISVEGNGRFRDLSFPISLSKSAPFDVSARFSTKDLSANAPGDYSAQNAGQVVIKAGQTRAKIIVRVTGDTVEEADEQFGLQLLSPKRATIGDGEAIGVIKDDDYAGIISIGEASKLELNSGQEAATIAVTLSQPALHPLEVRYSTSDDSAKASQGDYLPTRGALLFQPGDVSLGISVPVVGDTLVERDEKLFVRISSPFLPKALRAHQFALFAHQKKPRRGDHP